MPSRRDVEGLMAAVIVLIALTCPGESASVSAADAQILKTAQDAFDARKYDQAVKLLEPLIARYPDVGDIPRLLAHAHYELRQFDRARKMAIAAIGAGRASPDVLVRVAQIDQQRDDKQALINVVRLLTFLEPESNQWRLVYADLLAGTNAVNEAIAVYQSLVSKQPDSADLHLRLGNALAKQGRSADAASALETAWHLGAGDTRLPALLAGVWQSLGDDHQALAWLDRADALGAAPDPKQKLLHGTLLWKTGDLNRATAIATQLTKSETSELKGQARVLLGRIAMQQGRVDHAIEHWQHAAADGVESPELLTVLGMHYFDTGKYSAAVKVLRRVVDREDADNEQNLRNLIVSMLRANDRQAAQTYLGKYVERHGLSDPAMTLVRLLAQHNDEASQRAGER
jgi:tetratricopeptide (TPR) repeat protein